MTRSEGAPVSRRRVLYLGTFLPLGAALIAAGATADSNERKVNTTRKLLTSTGNVDTIPTIDNGGSMVVDSLLDDFNHKTDLTPNQEYLLAEAKKRKKEFNFRYRLLGAFTILSIPGIATVVKNSRPSSTQ